VRENEKLRQGRDTGRIRAEESERNGSGSGWQEVGRWAAKVRKGSGSGGSRQTEQPKKSNSFARLEFDEESGSEEGDEEGREEEDEDEEGSGSEEEGEDEEVEDEGRRRSEASSRRGSEDEGEAISGGDRSRSPGSRSQGRNARGEDTGSSSRSPRHRSQRVEGLLENSGLNVDRVLQAAADLAKALTPSGMRRPSRGGDQETEDAMSNSVERKAGSGASRRVTRSTSQARTGRKGSGVTVSSAANNGSRPQTRTHASQAPQHPARKWTQPTRPSRGSAELPVIVGKAPPRSRPAGSSG
jgi:hypothetical protein